MLVMGAALGQGSILIAQTHLIANDNATMVGEYGLTFSVIVLLQYVVDFGGTVTLARDVVAKREAIKQLFWALALSRLAIALTFGTTILLFTLSSSSQFSAAYFRFAIAGLVLNSINLSGVLDGIHASGPNGLSSTPQYALTAIVLPFAAGMAPSEAGRILGLASSAGIVLTLMIQYAALGRYGLSIGRPNFTARLVLGQFQNGLLYMTTWLPTQAVYRLQLIALTAGVGPASTGVFIFARQFVSAILQGVAFTRRVEFPLLVSLVQGSQSIAIRRLLKTQRLSIISSTLGSLGLLIIGLSFRTLDFGALSASATPVILFSALPLTGGLYATTVQYALATNRLLASTIASLSLLACATIPLLISGAPTISYVIVLEISANAVAAGMIVVLLRDTLPSR